MSNLLHLCNNPPDIAMKVLALGFLIQKQKIQDNTFFLLIFKPHLEVI